MSDRERKKKMLSKMNSKKIVIIFRFDRCEISLKTLLSVTIIRKLLKLCLYLRS